VYLVSMSDSNICLFSDGSGIWCRHWNGEIFQHQVPLLGSCAKRGGSSNDRACSKDAWWWSNSHCRHSIATRISTGSKALAAVIK